MTAMWSSGLRGIRPPPWIAVDGPERWRNASMRTGLPDSTEHVAWRQRMRDLVGKVAVVTGAASGIGKAIVQRLAGEDMRIIVVDVDERALASTVEEVGKSGAT